MDEKKTFAWVAPARSWQHLDQGTGVISDKYCRDGPERRVNGQGKKAHLRTQRSGSKNRGSRCVPIGDGASLTYLEATEKRIPRIPKPEMAQEAKVNYF